MLGKQKDKMEIITNIEANENINKDKLNATIKQISKLIKKNKRKNVKKLGVQNYKKKTKKGHV